MMNSSDKVSAARHPDDRKPGHPGHPAVAGPRKSIPGVVTKNIATLLENEQKEDARQPLADRLAHGIARFTGSTWFVLLHLVWFSAWIIWNEGLLMVRPFDPYPFGLLMLIVSLEAIFLSAFVLISQNQLARRQDERFNLDLQINLLAEHEVTKLLGQVQKLCERLGVADDDQEIGELTTATEAGEVLAELKENAAQPESKTVGTKRGPSNSESRK